MTRHIDREALQPRIAANVQPILETVQLTIQNQYHL